MARLGGDEFTILLDKIKHISDATCVAERLQQQLATPFTIHGHEVFTTASIGIALSATGYNQPEDILRDAETAMYRAKTLGKACYEVFDTRIRVVTLCKWKLICDGPWAPRICRLLPPLVDLKRPTRGVRALVRWQHPQRGLVSPPSSSPAEETGLIVPIGAHAARGVKQMYPWQQQFRRSTAGSERESLL
jgi:predicted signal transduction protein with EAL and GGDEF domain